MSDPIEHAKCVAASLASEDVELVPVENPGNRLSAAAALNRGWQRASGDLLVFCHQDVVFPTGWVGRLREQIQQVEDRTDGRWGIAGIFGRSGEAWVGHVQDRFGRRRVGVLPGPVDTLDESCLIVRRDLPLRFDLCLPGYHLYGVDLCLEALSRGLPNFALDCCVTHLGVGDKGEEYRRVRRVLERKWRRRRWSGGSGGQVPAKLHGPNGRLRFGLRYSRLRSPGPGAPRSSR